MGLSFEDCFGGWGLYWFKKEVALGGGFGRVEVELLRGEGGGLADEFLGRRDLFHLNLGSIIK